MIQEQQQQQNELAERSQSDPGFPLEAVRALVLRHLVRKMLLVYVFVIFHFETAGARAPLSVYMLRLMHANVSSRRWTDASAKNI